MTKMKELFISCIYKCWIRLKLLTNTSIVKFNFIDVNDKMINLKIND